MSTRKPKNQKGYKKKGKSAKKSDEAKFFVLSPNILQKLGINLGTETNENHSKEDHLESYDTGAKHDLSQKKRKSKKSESNDISTSLSETAAILKNSVLLSPTFSHNTIEGTSSKDFVNTSNIGVIDTYLCDTHKKKEVNPDKGKKIKDTHSKATNDELRIPLNSVYTVNGDKEISTHELHQNNASNLITEDSGDFVFKVPYAQINNLTGSEGVAQNKNIAIPKNDPGSPILPNNIEPSQFVSTVGKETKRELVKQHESNEYKSFDNKKIQQNDICYDLKAINEIGNNFEITANTTVKVNEITDTSVDDSTALHTNTKNATEVCENYIDIQNPRKDAKVKEIADYLTKCARKATLHTKRTKVVSKSSIQGVEKPGGVLEVNKSGALTYERKLKQTSQKESNIMKNHIENPVLEYRNIDYEALSTITNDQSYCNCYDFGSFMNLDESIHFSDIPSLKIQKDVIFEIYNNDYKSLVMESDSFLDINKLDQSDVCRAICWNNFEPKENLNDNESANNVTSDDNDLNIFKPSLMEVTETSEQINKPEHTCNTDKLNKLPDSNITSILQQKEHLRKGNVININENNVNVAKASSNIQTCSESHSHVEHATDTSVNISIKLSPVKPVPNVMTKSNEKKSDSRKVDEKDRQIISTLNKRSSYSLQQNSEDNFNKGGKKSKKSLDTDENNKKSIKCGVCDTMLSENQWDLHSKEVHCFIAWHSGQDFDDIFNSNLEERLNKMVQTGCGLKCTFCYVEFKETLAFIDHVKKCKMPKDVTVINEESSVDSEDEQTLSEMKQIKDSCSPTFKCGVCLTNTSNWIDHICKEHKYIAWKNGEKPLEFNDENDARVYLQNLLKEIGELVCYKCGLVRKQARAYLKHIKACDKNISLNFSITSDMSQVLDTSCSEKCGVCGIEVNSDNWINHITKQHEYIAWKEGEEPLDFNDEEQIRLHLHRITKQIGGLTCPKCLIVRKYAKSYIEHLKECTGQVPVQVSPTSITTDRNVDIIETPSSYKCGVCSKQIDCNDWIDHIFKEHEYIAWKDGDTPLKIEDQDQMKEHLFNVNKLGGGLKCPKCGIIRKYVKLYMSHVETCTGESKELNDSDDDLPEEVRCGVCKMEMKREAWISHIEENHNYLAWWDTEEPLDLNNEEEVNEHLRNISYSNGGLKCTKCDFVVKKFPKRYLDHIKTNCTNLKFSEICVKKENTKEFKVKREKNDVLECARCHKQVTVADWQDHAMKEHYNIAWAVGDTPINIKNQNSVDKYLKAYLRRFKTYRCKVCNLTRVSSYGFYAHIIVCGKSDKETEIFKEHCNICNEKYLCVYKSQHMTAHKESELTKLRRIELQEKNEKALMLEEEPPKIVSGKRRAAEKAISVIGNISKDDNLGKSETFSDSDESVNLDSADTEESESEVDSDISDLEHQDRALSVATEKLRTHNETFVEYAKTLPFDVSDKSSFLLNSAKDFAGIFYTEGVLFLKWRPFPVDALYKDMASEYLPILEQSCPIYFDDNFVTMKRFESIKGHQKASYLFVGGTIRQVCWVPVNLNDNKCDNYLTVVCHNSGDVPEHKDVEIVSGPGSIQIWNCENFNRLPSLSMVIVHDYGVIWSVAWCPSGARDLIDTAQPGEHHNLRLGLLACACSNGRVYIFSVPYPANDETMFIKVKPVAELRMTSNEERRLYQATSINWSRNKGHDTILVGYSDGTICYYNISSNSPILTNNENGVDVFYPYNEIKAHSGCITGVGSFPGEAGEAGAVCSSSSLGSSLWSGRGGVGRKTIYPVDNMFMSQHWPAGYLAGDACLMNALAPSDVEFWGNTRRLGLVHTMAECACCGLVATYNFSQIRLMRPYPAYADIRKRSVMAIDIKHLAKKRKIKSDELGVVVEPLTYNDAIQKYGLSIKSFNPQSAVPAQPKPMEVCIERYPLNAVTSMDFCYSNKFHNKLSVGVQAGIVIITNVI